jgi:hypothetical protein
MPNEKSNKRGTYCRVGVLHIPIIAMYEHLHPVNNPVSSRTKQRRTSRTSSRSSARRGAVIASTSITRVTSTARLMLSHAWWNRISGLSGVERQLKPSLSPHFGTGGIRVPTVSQVKVLCFRQIVTRVFSRWPTYKGEPPMVPDTGVRMSTPSSAAETPGPMVR